MAAAPPPAGADGGDPAVDAKPADDAMATDEQQAGGGGSGGAPATQQQQWTYKLADFGLAAQRRAGGGSRGVQEGDARYLAAELLRGEADRLDKADVFALGATLYELATGGALPAGGPLWHRLRSGRLSLLPSVGAPMAALLRQLMAEDPGARPTAAAILRAPALLAAEAAAAGGGGGGGRGRG